MIILTMMMMMVYRCLPCAVDQWMAKWRPAKGGSGDDGDGQDYEAVDHHHDLEMGLVRMVTIIIPHIDGVGHDAVGYNVHIHLVDGQ